MDTEAKIKELANEMWACQDACNLSAVVHTWHKAISELWKVANELKHSTDWVNQHFINKWYADKCRQLAGPIDILDDNIDKYILDNDTAAPTTG